MSNDPRRRYFVATGPDAQALITKVEQKALAHFERTKAYTAQYGAKFVMQTGGYPTGILLAPDQPVPEGFKFQHLITHEDVKYQLCQPAGGSKAARAARAAAAKVGLIGVSEMICRHYDVDSLMFIVGGSMSWHATGWCNPKQKLVTLQVPENAENRFVPFGELREITHAQYVAITEEGAPAPSSSETNLSKRLRNIADQGEQRKLPPGIADHLVQAAQEIEKLSASFQSRVAPWMQECFGPEISADKVERNDRFIEEALELVQAGGMPKEHVLALVDYTYSRPVGDLPQEVGGVMVTLAALCLAQGVDMHAEAETELARISLPAMVAKIRAKQATKPRGSPLPVPKDAKLWADGIWRDSSGNVLGPAA